MSTSIVSNLRFDVHGAAKSNLNPPQTEVQSIWSMVSIRPSS